MADLVQIGEISGNKNVEGLEEDVGRGSFRIVRGTRGQIYDDGSANELEVLKSMTRHRRVATLDEGGNWCYTEWSHTGVPAARNLWEKDVS